MICTKASDSFSKWALGIMTSNWLEKAIHIKVRSGYCRAGGVCQDFVEDRSLVPPTIPLLSEKRMRHQFHKVSRSWFYQSEVESPVPEADIQTCT